MTVASGNFIAWTYTDDLGNDYRVKARKAITDQVDGSSNVIVGGSAASATVERPPKGLTMRHVFVDNGSGVVRKVIVYEPTAPLYTTIGQTVSLMTGTAEASFTWRGSRTGEVYKNGCGQAS